MHSSMLQEADIRILAGLQSPQSIDDISRQTGYSSGYVSDRIAHLATLDLVETRRGRSKQVRALRTPVLEAYKDLTSSYPAIDYASLISPSMLRVCWFLDEPTAVPAMVTRLTLRRRRIYQLLEALQARGFISKHGTQYVLTERQRGLATFAKVVIEYEHQHRAQSLAPTANAIWSAPHEALVVVSEATPGTAQGAFEHEENWFRTGLVRFADYGLEFFTTSPALYFYSELQKTLQAADFIAHMLVHKADTRNLSYCALLMVAVDVSSDDLRASASYFEIEETIEALVTLVENRERTPTESVTLPSWDEVASLAAQYGVSV